LIFVTLLAVVALVVVVALVGGGRLGRRRGRLRPGVTFDLGRGGLGKHCSVAAGGHLLRLALVAVALAVALFAAQARLLGVDARLLEEAVVYFVGLVRLHGDAGLGLEELLGQRLGAPEQHQGASAGRLGLGLAA